MFIDNMEFERDINHCEVSKHVKQVTIKSIVPIPDRDYLESLYFNEIGWRIIEKRGLHKKGEAVTFIPVESVLPLNLSEELNITKYLSKGKVRPAKFGSHLSEGLIVDNNIIEPYLNYIYKWEDTPSTNMDGTSLETTYTNPIFHNFHDIPNIMNCPDLFKVGERIYYSEKIHGSNGKAALLENPITHKYDSYVGNHRRIFKKSDNIYWNAYKKYLMDKLPHDIVFFFEVFEKGIQDLHYDRLLDLRIFAATRRGYYIKIPILKVICDYNQLPLVNFTFTKFKSIDELRNIADKPSEYTTNHMREGIVIVSAQDPHRMAKLINLQYLSRHKQKERH